MYLFSNLHIKCFVGIVCLLILSCFFSLMFSCDTPDGIMETIQDSVSAKVTTFVCQQPLQKSADNLILGVKLQVNDTMAYTVNAIKIRMNGTTDLNDLESVSLFYSGMNGTTDLNDLESVSLFYSGLDETSSGRLHLFGRSLRAAPEIIFQDQLKLKGNSCFKLFAKLKNKVDLLHRMDASCEAIAINGTEIVPGIKSPEGPLRLAIALRKSGDDQVSTFRIPGLITTNNGTLLAIYDVRRDSDRDLQGNIDIGLSRSTDGGNTWEPMRIVLDRGTWGGLPQKFNGVSDACILVDRNSNTVFVAGLWMYGVINANGIWITGLNESSQEWNHQWWTKGSQPGFDVKQTSQFLITNSTDDGKTWSEPVNLTKMCKKEGWWLWAPAPGHGITLDDGILVFPTQGRDENGVGFSNITWSKDGGKSWTASRPAGHNINESMVVQLDDGSIMINARDYRNINNNTNTNGRMVAVTKDLGETWISHPSSGKPLIEPFCMGSLHKHEYTVNGQRKSILLFSNPNSKTSRDHLTIKVSFDNGETWPEKYWLLLDEGKGSGYSCMTSINEQTIGILYEGSGTDLVFQKIALSELVQDK